MNSKPQESGTFFAVDGFVVCDIGAYNTCGHLCRYCYANYDSRTVMDNRKRHNPRSPLLLGEITEDDVVHAAKQESWRDMQLKLWL